MKMKWIFLLATRIQIYFSFFWVWCQIRARTLNDQKWSFFIDFKHKKNTRYIYLCSFVCVYFWLLLLFFSVFRWLFRKFILYHMVHWSIHTSHSFHFIWFLFDLFSVFDQINNITPTHTQTNERGNEKIQFNRLDLQWKPVNNKKNNENRQQNNQYRQTRTYKKLKRKLAGFQTTKNIHFYCHHW